MNVLEIHSKIIYLFLLHLDFEYLNVLFKLFVLVYNKTFR
jgi:uncharacterized membrane protein